MNHRLKSGLLLIGMLSLFVAGCETEQHKIFGTGTFEAREVTISAQTPGVIEEMPVEEGQRIEKGALIAQLNIEKQLLTQVQLEAGLAEVDLNISLAREQISLAQIQYDNVKRNYERFARLLQEKSTSEQSVDNLQTQYESAEKNLKSAKIRVQAALAKKKQLQAQIELVKQQIADATVTSPLSGIILRKLRRQGEFAITGLGMVEIADLSEMDIRIYISEDELGLIKQGETLSIQIDSHPDSTFTGTVSWISPKAEFTPKNVQTKEARANLVYAVKLSVPNPDGILKIGMPADVFKD